MFSKDEKNYNDFDHDDSVLGLEFKKRAKTAVTDWRDSRLMENLGSVASDCCYNRGMNTFSSVSMVASFSKTTYNKFQHLSQYVTVTRDMSNGNTFSRLHRPTDSSDNN